MEIRTLQRVVKKQLWASTQRLRTSGVLFAHTCSQETARSVFAFNLPIDWLDLVRGRQLLPTGPSWDLNSPCGLFQMRIDLLFFNGHTLSSIYGSNCFFHQGPVKLFRILIPQKMCGPLMVGGTDADKVRLGCRRQNETYECTQPWR